MRTSACYFSPIILFEFYAVKTPESPLWMWLFCACAVLSRYVTLYPVNGRLFDKCWIKGIPLHRPPYCRTEFKIHQFSFSSWLLVRTVSSPGSKFDSSLVANKQADWRWTGPITVCLIRDAGNKLLWQSMLLCVSTFLPKPCYIMYVSHVCFVLVFKLYLK